MGRPHTARTFRHLLAAVAAAPAADTAESVAACYYYCCCCCYGYSCSTPNRLGFTICMCTWHGWLAAVVGLHMLQWYTWGEGGGGGGGTAAGQDVVQGMKASRARAGQVTIHTTWSTASVAWDVVMVCAMPGLRLGESPVRYGVPQEPGCDEPTSKCSSTGLPGCCLGCCYPEGSPCWMSCSRGLGSHLCTWVPVRHRCSEARLAGCW